MRANSGQEIQALSLQDMQVAVELLERLSNMELRHRSCRWSGMGMYSTQRTVTCQSTGRVLMIPTLVRSVD